MCVWGCKCILHCLKTMLSICNSTSGAKTNKEISSASTSALSMNNLELHKMTTRVEKNRKEERWSLLSYLHLNIYKIVVFWTNYWFSFFSSSASWTFNSIYLLVSPFSLRVSLYWTLRWSNFICTVTRTRFTFGLVLLFPLHTSILEPKWAWRKLTLIDC